MISIDNFFLPRLDLLFKTSGCIFILSILCHPDKNIAMRLRLLFPFLTIAKDSQSSNLQSHWYLIYHMCRVSTRSEVGASGCESRSEPCFFKFFQMVINTFLFFNSKKMCFFEKNRFFGKWAFVRNKTLQRNWKKLLFSIFLRAREKHFNFLEQNDGKFISLKFVYFFGEV